MLDAIDSPSANYQPLSVRIFPSPRSHTRLLQSFDSQTQASNARYRDWRGKNVFLCGGTIMLGVHWQHFCGTLVMIALSWFEFIFLVIPFTRMPYLLVAALGLCTLNAVLAISVAISDPGIQPRLLFRKDKSASVNLIRKDAAALQSQFCKLCNIWRPARARHCKYCDNCVDVFDHHCPWTGTCIGARNYPPFLLFVISVFLSALLHIAVTVHVALGWALVGAHTDMFLLRFAVLVVNIPWACMVVFLVGTLLLFHLYLIARGQTTNEYFRERRALREKAAAMTRNNSEASAAATSKPAGSTLCFAAGFTAGLCQRRFLRCTRSGDSQASREGTVNTVNSLPDDVDPRSPGEIRLVTVSNTEEESLLQSLGGSALRAATEMVITPMYDADSTPFPELSPSPFSPVSPPSPVTSDAAQKRASPSGGVHREGIAALRLDLERADERAGDILPAFTQVAGLSPGEEKVDATQSTEHRVHWALPRSASTQRTGGAYTPLPAAPNERAHTERAAQAAVHGDGRYTYCCLCVPIVPHSRLLPQWHRHDEADEAQQEQLLQELFQRMTAALRKNALQEDEVTV